MLEESLIKTLAVKFQTTELNIRREYAQHLFLSYFYQQPETKKVWFKGGTALRLIYQSPRFSEDLDFEAAKTSINKLESGIINSLAEIEREGIKAEIIESKKTTGGYLGEIKFQLKSQKIIVLVEVSFRDKNSQGEIQTIVSNFRPPYTLMSLTTTQMIEQKIKALLIRQKPRDFYDVYFILRANLLAVGQRVILKQVLIKLRETKIDFKAELKLFLPKDHWGMIKDFKVALEREIKRYI